MDNEKRVKAQYFFDTQRDVHLSCSGRKFYNGKIKEMSEEFFIFIDRKLGDLPIFFSEIYTIELYEVKE